MSFLFPGPSGCERPTDEVATPLCRTQTHFPKRSPPHNSRGHRHVEHTAAPIQKLSERVFSPKTAPSGEKLIQKDGPHTARAEGSVQPNRVATNEETNRCSGEISPSWGITGLNYTTSLGSVILIH